MRASLEHMRALAQQNGLPQISMHRFCGSLDQLEWKVVRQLIQDTFKTSLVVIVVYHEKAPKSVPSRQATEAVNPLVKAQQAGESVRQIRKWVRRGSTRQKKNQMAYPVLDGKCITN